MNPDKTTRSNHAGGQPASLSEAQFRAYFEMGAIGIVATSPQKGLFHFNDRLCEILGYPREELAAKNWAELTHPEDLAADNAKFARVVTGEVDGYQIEKRFIRKDGSVVHARVTGKSLGETSSSGSAPTFIAMVQDISQRKKAEAALRKTEERLELAMRSSRDGLWDWDIQTNEVNYGLRVPELLGYGREVPAQIQNWLQNAPDQKHAWGVLRAHFDAQLHPEDRETFWHAVQKHLYARVPLDVDCRLKTKSGEYRWFRSRAQAMWDEAGRPKRLAGSISDIHEQRVAEASLREIQAREMAAQEEFMQRLILAQDQERKRLAEELHDGVAADLSLIRNRTQMALKRPDLDPAVEADLAAISRLATEAIAEVRGLFRNLRPLPIEQRGLTEALRTLVDEAAASSLIRFQGRFEDIDDIFHGDQATIVYRIVQEALNNALKHSQAARGSVLVERDLHCARIRIEDWGCGFDLATISDSTRSGIGLTSMEERARILRASFRITSKPGAGTTVLLEVPIKETSDDALEKR